MKTTYAPGPYHLEKPFGEPGLYISNGDTSLLAKIFPADPGHYLEDKRVTAEATGKLLATSHDLLIACRALHDALSNILEDCASADRDGEIKHVYGNEYEIGRDHRAAGLCAIRKSFKALAKVGEFEI